MQNLYRNGDALAADNAKHMRFILTETQKAMDILVKSMSSTQGAIQNMAAVVLAIYNKMNGQDPEKGQ